MFFEKSLHHISCKWKQGGEIIFAFCIIIVREGEFHYHVQNVLVSKIFYYNVIFTIFFPYVADQLSKSLLKRIPILVEKILQYWGYVLAQLTVLKLVLKSVIYNLKGLILQLLYQFRGKCMRIRCNVL